MKLAKFLAVFALFTLFLIGATAQPCNTGDISFSTQAEIDAFPVNYPSCDQIDGNVVIDDGGSGDIVNLNGLSSIVYMGASLTIRNNPDLTSLSGLANLVDIGGDFTLYNNAGLSDLTGLGILQTIGGFSQVNENGGLTSLTGLSALSSVGSNFNIYSNPSLLDLGDFGSLTSLNDVYLSDNAALTSLTGLEGVSTMSGLVIGSNALVDMQGLNSLTSVNGRVSIGLNLGMTSLTGLDALATVGGEFFLTSNANLVDMTGLGALTTVSSSFYISGNIDLQNLNGLNSLSTVAGESRVSGNGVLNSVTALSPSLTSVSYLNIFNNPNLTSLDGLENIEPTTLTNVGISNSTLLSDCAVQSICEYLEGSGPAFIQSNATGCNSIAEVEVACGLVLPAELLTFTVEKSGETALLTWRTASEANLSHYEIERSADGKAWAPIGQVSAYNSGGSSYTFTDERPLPGTSYYRLQLVDLDGSLEYSEIKAVAWHLGGVVQIFPNPANGELTIELPEAEADFELRVTNSMGVTVLRAYIAAGTKRQLFDVSKLPPGIYAVRAGTPATRQFVKQ